MKFRDFIRKLDSEGRLLRISKEVKAEYEAAAYLKKYDGKPVLFEHVKAGNADMPVVGNLYSSMDLLCESLGISKSAWIETLGKAIENPSEISRAAENGFRHYEPDLGLLPILKHYPLDQGPYITSGVVFASYNGISNISFHRLAKLGKDRLVGMAKTLM